VGISQTLRRGIRNGITKLFRGRHRHLYSVGWPLRWASAHILVTSSFGAVVPSKLLLLIDVTACSWMRRQGDWWVNRPSHLPSLLSTHQQVTPQRCKVTLCLFLIQQAFGIYWQIIVCLFLHLCPPMMTFVLEILNFAANYYTKRIFV